MPKMWVGLGKLDASGALLTEWAVTLPGGATVLLGSLAGTAVTRDQDRALTSQM